MFKFLHTADIHLDSPLLSLEQYDGAPVEEFRSATRRAFDNVIDLAINQQVHFVIIAGDLYDGDCRDFQTAIHFRQKMEWLQQHGIRVYIVQGNHDAQSNITKAFRLQLPDNTHLFPTNKPQTELIDDLHVAIHGQGFPTRAVEEDLSANYPEPVLGYYNIGMLHTSCGTHSAHDRYAPSTIKGLSSKNYDYWALGHIHKQQKLAGPRPQILYPGNVQGRHIGETGAKGCTIVTVGDDGKAALKFHATDVLRWEHCQVDAATLNEAIDLPATVANEIEALLNQAEDRPLAVRITIDGASTAHRDIVRQADHWDREIRTTMLDRFDTNVWVEKIRFKTNSAIDRSDLDQRDDALAELIAGIDDYENLEYIQSELADDLKRVETILPSDPRLADDKIDFSDESTMAALLSDAKELLVSRLLESTEDEA